jgi:hypothetical protein
MNPHEAGKLASKNDPKVPADQREPIEFQGLDRLRFWQGRREADETAARLRESRLRLWYLGSR